MEGNNRLLRTFLGFSTALAALSGCVSEDHSAYGHASVDIVLEDACPATRADMPDEEKISDVSLMIFDRSGDLEKGIYLSGGKTSAEVRLLKGMRYSVYACVNFGYEVKVSNISELHNIMFHLAYPDEYREGIPMCATHEDILITGDTTIGLELVRLMSRISVRMDRSQLSENVRMDVTGIRIGNCPKKVRVFSPSRADNEDDCFASGFSHEGEMCRKLNTPELGSISQEISLFMLENMQGKFSTEGPGSDEEKVFKDDDIRSRICSFVEVEMDYSSPEWTSGEEHLIYRFYLGENRNSLDVERNCHYRITICPEDDGLKGDGWRVDKSGLKYTGKTSLTQYPGGYISGNIGSKVHIGCVIIPPFTPFDVGQEYMEADKAEGIYDYEIDPDGHGATLTLTGPGRGLIYMEAGEPVNDAALFVIEVNSP